MAGARALVFLVVIEHAQVVRDSDKARFAALGARKGSITEGKLADLVLLSDALFSNPPRQILTTKPPLTIVAGRIVHDALDDEAGQPAGGPPRLKD